MSYKSINHSTSNIFRYYTFWMHNCYIQDKQSKHLINKALVLYNTSSLIPPFFFARSEACDKWSTTRSGCAEVRTWHGNKRRFDAGINQIKMWWHCFYGGICTHGSAPKHCCGPQRSSTVKRKRSQWIVFYPDGHHDGLGGGGRKLVKSIMHSATVKDHR